MSIVRQPLQSEVVGVKAEQEASPTQQNSGSHCALVGRRVRARMAKRAMCVLLLQRQKKRPTYWPEKAVLGGETKKTLGRRI